MKKNILFFSWSLFFILLLTLFNNFFVDNNSTAKWKTVPSKLFPEISKIEKEIFPQELIWPPKSLYIKDNNTNFFWASFNNKASSETKLWIGNNVTSFPLSLEQLKYCLKGHNNPNCPTGWKVFSLKLENDKVIFFISNLNNTEIKNIIKAL